MYQHDTFQFENFLVTSLIVLSVFHGYHHWKASALTRVAPPGKTAETTSTTLSTEASCWKTTPKAAPYRSTHPGTSSFGLTTPTPLLPDEHQSMDLCRMFKKELLQGRVLQSMWVLLVMVKLWLRFILFLEADGSMETRSTQDTQKTEPISRKKRTRKRTERSTSNKGKWKRWRLCHTAIGCAMAAAIYSSPNHGSPATRSSQLCGPAGCATEPASGWIVDGIADPPEKPWPGSQSRGRSLFSQEFGTSGYQACLAEIGGIWQGGCEAESRISTVDHQLEQISTEARAGIRRTDEKIQRKEGTNPGGHEESRRRISSCTRSATRGRRSQDHCCCSRSASPQGGRKAGTQWHSQKKGEDGRVRRRRSSAEEASHSRRSHSSTGLPCLAKNGFLNGRHDSCYNVHARGLRFFCMVEVLILDEKSAPDEVQRTMPTWWNLSTPPACQTIPWDTAHSICLHTYGPRQAEYVAQLMRIDVETGTFHEAFEHCFWDETMDDLLLLDQIEKTSQRSSLIEGIQQPELVRQIEGSTLWTLLAMDSENPVSGGTERYGTTSQQGFLSQLSEEDLNGFYQSLQEDCNFAAQIIVQQESSSRDGIKIISYGHFGAYHGSKMKIIPPEHLHLWTVLVKQQWTDYEIEENIALHIATPQPHDGSFELHIVVRSMDNPAEHHFLLVDQVEASPQAVFDRSVLEVSRQPNGYEILLTSGIDLDMVTSNTILKHGNLIWQHHQTLQVQDGQYWRILVETHTDETVFMQVPLEAEHCFNLHAPTPRGRSFHPHVLDRWCDGWNNLEGVPRSNYHKDSDDIEEISFIQRQVSAASSATESHHFFRFDEGPFRLNIPQDADFDMHTHVENHLQLPTAGPSSIRTLHWVASPPNLLEPTQQVHIIELRGDADQRLMNDDVICLFLLTFAHPTDVNDYSERFRVLWTPRIASRERILLHLRAADLCRERTCHLQVNNILWQESDSVIKHFKDGDFVHLRIVIQPGSSVIATRCDFQGYEQTERHRRVFTNTTSSEELDNSPQRSSNARSRSRARTSDQDDSDTAPLRPVPSQAPELDDIRAPSRSGSDRNAPTEQEEESDPQPNSEENSQELDDDSLLQISSRSLTQPRTLQLMELIPATTVVTRDFTEVDQARDLLSAIPWILDELWNVSLPSTVLEAAAPYLIPWQGETPTSYHLYTDGSFRNKSPNAGGCGVILMVETSSGLLCGGVLSRTCLPTSRSHSAESIAMLWATLVAYQLSGYHNKHFPGVPFVIEFGFDAQVTGQQCAGHWTSFKHPAIQQMSRNLIYILQHRHGPTAVQWTHIKAHQGHCWNEIADQLAGHATRHPDMVPNSDLLYALLDADSVMTACNWIWALEQMEIASPSLPTMFDKHLYHFRTTNTSQHTSLGPSGIGIPPPPTTPTVHHLHMKVATMNVMTLDTKRDKKMGIGMTARHLSLLQQCDEHALHVVGVQETRALKTTNRNNQYYHIVSSPCRSDGHYGVQIWIHKHLPLGGEERPIQEDDYRIIWMDPNVLAIRLKHPALHCIIIAARAPTSDKPRDELQAFWSTLTSQIVDKYPGWKTILLCDSNSHVGSTTSTSISDFGEETENLSGEIFHDWLLRNDIWLPSTWDNVHQGDHFTYVTIKGNHHHRLDFVGLSHNWPLDFVATSVAHTIDVSMTRYDHLPAICTFKATVTTPGDGTSSTRRKPTLDRKETATFLRQQPHYLAEVNPVPWTLNVHQHATDLATNTLERLHQVIPRTRRQLRKRHLNDLTWAVLNWKRRLRKHLIDAWRRYRYGPLREIFTAWQEQKRGAPYQIMSHARWFKWMDIKIALLEHNLARVQPILQQMLRQDDALFYQHIAERAGRVEQEDGLQGLWKEIRSTLPKWRSRRALQKHGIDDELCQHFASLEAGTVTTFTDLFRKCVHHQNKMISRDAPPQSYDLMDFPTLFEIEQMCRKTTPARAAGPDTVLPEICRIGAAGIAKHVHNMIFKICCEEAEPIWYKGGYVHPIYKAKGAYDDPTSYRGVVLLDVFGKKFHAWLRSRLVPILQGRRAAGQLGGLPCEQTLTGAHLLRIHGQVARSLRVSSAVIFVDVRAAFHHMLRELIFLHGTPGLDPTTVLDSAHFDLDALQSLLRQRCEMNPKDFPPALRRLADDVHRHTWFQQNGTTLDQQMVVETLRGTRPGSPVADVGFNLLTSDILEELEQRLNADAIITAGGAGFPCHIPPITWVDDLAVPITTAHPLDLEPVIQQVLQHIHQVFYSRGLQINYDKGKTEVVIMFRGGEADSAREKFFSATREAYITTATETHVFRVRAVPSYKHLGIRFQMDSDLTHEVQSRAAQARTAFNEVRRQIFKNRALTVTTRLHLLQSLVFSKLLYGCGTWYELPRRTVSKLDSLMMKFHRSILDEGYWQANHVTDAELRQRHQLPTFRMTLAIARLRYLRHVAQHDHEYHRVLLLTERAYQRGWLFELEDDVDWLHACLDLPDMPSTPHTVDEWAHFLQWLRDNQVPWKSWLRRAAVTHHLREQIAAECISFHDQAIETLRLHGAIIHEPIENPIEAISHSCPECNATFATSTALAVHRAKGHGIHSPIKDYIQSEVCPGCLKHMWTTQRVIQHLRYRPNRCLDRIIATCQPRGYIPIGLPDHLSKVKRLPATRRHYGPLLPLPHERERVQLRQRLQECEEHGAQRDFWSKINPAMQDLANVRLSAAAHRWLGMDSDDGDALFEALLEAAAKLPYPQLVQEKCLIGWITHTMWDDVAEWPPGALQVLEREHQQILNIIPLWLVQTERDELKRLLASDEIPRDWDPMRPIIPPHPKKHRRAQPVPMRYAAMEQMEAKWKNLVLVTTVQAKTVVHPDHPIDGAFYIVHLYSGRRREQDLQWHLERLFHDASGSIQIISVDTAVHSMCDVNDSTTWGHFLELAASGRLLALILGPPCETWSGVRHECLQDEAGQEIKGPRPLRSSSRPWGLDSLLPREYRQLQVGMRLLLRGLLLSLITVLAGGTSILEHPAAPKQPDRASIWRVGLVKLLTESKLFRCYSFAQWRYHAAGVKPTTLLYGGLPMLPQVMRMHEDPEARRPLRALVGKDSSGSFKTGAAKEHPPRMNGALAACIHARWNNFSALTTLERPEWPPGSLFAFMNLLHVACSKIEAGRSWLPDYQGR